MAAHKLAQGLAALGRNGDSTLVHMQPHEVAGLQALAEANGTSLTMNPDTGLPEAFSLGGFFSSLLPTIAGGLVGAAGGPLTAGLLAGAATGALTNKKNPLMGGLMGGLGGYGGFGLGSAANAAGAAGAGASNAASAAPGTIESAGIPVNDYSGAITQAGGNAADPLTMDAMKNNLSQSWGGIKSIMGGDDAAFQAASESMGTPGAPASPFKMATAVGMPLGMAALSGMEPGDLGGGINMDKVRESDKYNPYSQLSLSGDTGLRLLATGGPVVFAAGGGDVRTGGITDLYSDSDQSNAGSISQDGYGLGRLSNLVAGQAQDRAAAGRFAEGGTPTLEDGGFVVPADVVFYAGGHSTKEGQKKLAQKYGAVPIRGPGNGLSDDIPTSIEGQQPARVADGEAYIPREVVQRHGGAKKFYKMMDKVRQQAHGSKKQAKAAKV